MNETTAARVARITARVRQRAEAIWNANRRPWDRHWSEIDAEQAKHIVALMATAAIEAVEEERGGT